MTKQELYLALYQATSTNEAIPGVTAVTDFDRPLSVHVSRNSGDEISYITLEFAGARSRFLSILVFDGSGDRGTGFSSFTMPKVKLNPRQRSIALLACLEFLIANDILSADFDYYVERVTVEHQVGRGGLIEHYQSVVKTAGRYLYDHPELYRGSHEEDQSKTHSF